MESIKLIEKITTRLVRTFNDLNELVTNEIKRVQQIQANTNNLTANQNQNIESVGNNIKDNTEKSKQAETILKSNIMIKQEDNNGIPKPHLQLLKIKAALKNQFNNEKPNKPLPAFKIFMNEVKHHSGRLQNLDETLVLKMATKLWDEMSKQKKQNYLEIERIQKGVYKEQLQNYYQNNPQQKQRQNDKKKRKALKKKEKQQKLEKMKQQHQKNQEENKINETIGKNDDSNKGQEPIQKKQYNYEIEKPMVKEEEQNQLQQPKAEQNQAKTRILQKISSALAKAEEQEQEHSLENSGELQSSDSLCLDL